MDGVHVAGVVMLCLSALVNIWHWLTVQSQPAQNTIANTGGDDQTKPGMCDIEQYTSGSLVTPIFSYTASIAALVYSAVIVTSFFNPNEAVLCHPLYVISTLFLAFHKTGLYFYLLVRARLTAHAACTRCYNVLWIYVAVIELVLFGTAFAIQTRYDPKSDNVCEGVGIVRLLWGALYLATDVIVGISLLVIFVSPLRQWLLIYRDHVDENPRNSSVGQSIRKVAVWALVAICSTLLSVPLALLVGDWGLMLILLDQNVNIVSVIQQYRALQDSETATMIMTMSLNTKNVENIDPKIRNLDLANSLPQQIPDNED